MFQEVAKGVGFGEGVSAEGFEEEVSEVAEGAIGLFDRELAVAIAFEELGEKMSDLEKKVELFGGVGSFGVSMFHLKACVFLRAKAFVFNAPSLSSSVLSQGTAVCVGDRDVGHPEKADGLSVGIRAFAEKDVEEVAFIGDGIDPGVFVADVIEDAGETIFWGEWSEGVKLSCDGRERTFFERDDVFPAKAFAEGEDGLIGVEGVEEKAELGARKGLFESGQDPMEGFEFAILLIGRVGAVVAGDVFDEFACDRESQSGSGEEFGLADGTIVEGLSVLGGLGETALGKGGRTISEKEMSGQVHADEIEFPEKAEVFETARLQKAPYQFGGKGPKVIETEAREIVVQSVSVGDEGQALSGEEFHALEERRRLQAEANLATRPEAGEKEKDSRPEKGGVGVGAEIRLSGIGDGAQAVGQPWKEAADHAAEEIAQSGVFFFLRFSETCSLTSAICEAEISATSFFNRRCS